MINSVTDITAKELVQMLAKGDEITIVDVRYAKDFARGHIPNAINAPVPWEELPANLPVQGDLVVVCYLGLYNRDCSKQLSLERGGVYRLEGGMSSWQGALSSDLFVSKWDKERYIRVIYGSTVILSALIAHYFIPWAWSITFLAGIGLVLGGLFDRGPIMSLYRGMGYK